MSITLTQILRTCLPSLALSIPTIAFLGCSKPASQKPTAAVPKVSVVVAPTQKIVDFDEFVGRTEASETVEVRARVSGFIEEVKFRDGDRVKKGDTLFLIQPDLYLRINEQSKSRVKLWEARKELADSKFNRAKILRDTDSISQEEFDEDIAAVKEAEASIVAAIADEQRTQLDVEYTDVKAEVGGRIDRAFVTPGNLVTGGLGSGTLLTRIVNNSPMYVYVDIDERSLLRYLRLFRKARGADDASVVDKNASTISLSEQNVPCYMQLGDEKDFPHVGKLDFIENRVDAATGTIRLRAKFTNEDWFLTGGLFVRLRVPVSDTYDAVLIPEQAIGTEQNVKFAYVVGDDNMPQVRQLTLGQQRGSMRVVKEGIKPGERVIFRGLQRVRKGNPVEAELVELDSAEWNANQLPADPLPIFPTSATVPTSDGGLPSGTQAASPVITPSTSFAVPSNPAASQDAAGKQ